MNQPAHLQHSFPELALALYLGYVLTFELLHGHELRCKEIPCISFEPSEVESMPICCTSHHATLYLIKTKKYSLKGTLIDYDNF